MCTTVVFICLNISKYVYICIHLHRCLYIKYTPQIQINFSIDSSRLFVSPSVCRCGRVLLCYAYVCTYMCICIDVYVFKRERISETCKHTQTQKQTKQTRTNRTHTLTQTLRRIDTQTHRHTDTQTHRHTDTQTNRCIDT